MRALRESSGEDKVQLYTLSEVEGMVGEVDDLEGEAP